MSAKKYPMCDLDDIQFRMECGVGILEALHECVEHGELEAQSYADALFGAYDYLSGLTREMRTAVDDLFSERKAAAAARREAK